MILFLKIGYTLIFCFFIVMISDFRNKKTNPLFLQIWLIVMRAGYLIPLFSSMFFLWKLEKITVYALISLLILVGGTLIVILSKKELGKRHTWAGYTAREADSFCVSGIYAWVRHPLYLGIMVVDVGIAFLVIPNLNVQLQLALTFLIGSFFTFIFLVISSIRETRYLADKFGASFLRYAQQVNAFFPIKKYKGSSEIEG